MKHTKRSTLRRSTLVLCAAALAAGCASQDQIDAQRAVTDYEQGNFIEARRLLLPLTKKTNEDFALNNCRLGSTSLALYDINTSQAAFQQAYEVLNSFGVNNGGRTLGAVLVDEKIKIWRGEPFERAMANVYLGLTYYMQGDYNNARGAFENALFKLRDYQPDGPQQDVNADKFRDVDSNFVLAQYLLARCYQRLGQDELAAANFKRVATLRPELVQLADLEMNRRSNVLLMVDYGDGPRKITNDDGSVVGFFPDPSRVGPPPRPVVSVDGAVVDTAGVDDSLVDLVVLAQDRKWQSIDTVRAVKSVVGTGLIAAGAVTAVSGRRPENAEVGLGLIAAGVLLKLASQADTRMWEMLPRCAYAVPMYIPPGKHEVTVQFPTNGSRQSIIGLDVPRTGEATYYFRVRYDGNPIAWPPATLSGWPAAEPQTPPGSAPAGSAPIGSAPAATTEPLNSLPSPP